MLLEGTLLKELDDLCELIFDSRGNQRACGREACIQLIEVCEKIDIGCEAGKYGSKEYGILNVKAVKNLAFDITDMGK